MPIPKCLLMLASLGHFGRLSPAAVHSANCQFGSGVKWWIQVSSIVTYLCKNSFLLHWNSCKQHYELSMHCCFWSTVSKCGTSFEYSFLIDKCSCKMINTQVSNIFNSFAISHNFNLWSAKMSLRRFFSVFQDNCQIWATWAFSISGVCTTTCKVSIPFLLFLIDQSLNNTYEAIALLEQNFFPLESNALSTHGIQIFPLF